MPLVSRIAEERAVNVVVLCSMPASVDDEKVLCPSLKFFAPLMVETRVGARGRGGEGNGLSAGSYTCAI